MADKAATEPHFVFVQCRSKESAMFELNKKQKHAVYVTKQRSYRQVTDSHAGLTHKGKQSS